MVEPGALRPGGGGDHYRVFSPYHRAWAASQWREELAAPRRIALPDRVRVGRLPALPAGDSPDAAVGGERVARQRLTDWLPDLTRYGDQHDDMAGDDTSRLSPYLRFGCVSPLAVANRAGGPVRRRSSGSSAGGTSTTRSPPPSRRSPPRPTGAGAAEQWRYDDDALAAWTEGRTGVPIVDAGMRQLRPRAGCTTGPG